MSDVIEKTIKDYYKDHQFHGAFMQDCSECYKENRLIQAHKLVNHEEVRKILNSRTSNSNPDHEFYNDHITPE